MKVLLLILAWLAGMATSTQTMINSQLRSKLNDPMQAVTVSFMVGTIVCWSYCLINRSSLPTSGMLRDIPWWMWTGGVLGAFTVWTMIVVTRQLGVATMLGIFVAGQMLSSLAIDHWGLFQSTIRPATFLRVVGGVLIILGVCLIALTPDRQ